MKRLTTHTALISIVLILSISVALAQVTEYSYATGNVSGKNYVGGFAGKVSGLGAVNDCFALGQVTGDAFVGGFAGMNEGTITNCYSTGKITAKQNTGGFTGINTGTVNTSYWDTQSSEMATSTGGTGKTTATMTYQNATTNLIGFDFTKVWQPDNSPVQNNGYPMLVNSKVYLLEVKSFPFGAGSVTTGGYFKSGELAVLAAVPGNQYIFKGWKAGNEIISTQLQFNYTVNQNTVLMAVFDNKSTDIQDKIETTDKQCIIYPNPATHQINVALSGGLIPERVAIYSIDGKKMLESVENDIDVSILRGGIYILKCYWQNDTFFSRFIKQ